MYKEHKAVMNEKCANFFIENFTKPNQIIYDPFMGCGTTAKIALLNKRRFLGSEITREYCDITEQRLKEFNNQLRLL